jgi:hypothetical protein
MPQTPDEMLSAVSESLAAYAAEKHRAMFA